MYLGLLGLYPLHLRPDYIYIEPSSLTCCDSFAGQQHDAGEADAEDGTLAKVEHGQCGCSFQRG